MLDKKYVPEKIESFWNQVWLESKIYEKVQKRENVDSYCIMLPPPNVTGNLHMGHAFQDTLMDVLIRHQAQQGKKVLWQPGVDHAGIATQMVVERQLQAQGLSRKDLGRDAFLEKIWEWKAVSGDSIISQLKRLGAFMNWDRECFTMDPHYIEAVTQCFVQLYRDGLIYQKERLVNWDVRLQSAVSDLEVDFQMRQGHLYHIAYQSLDSEDEIIVATTRPETIFGDVALAVHPQDERYLSFIGKEFTLPVSGHTVLVIADESVDREFGSGCVKITPAHDTADFAIGQRHNLLFKNILNKDGTLNENVPAPFAGMDRLKARPLVIEALKKAGVLRDVQAHEHQVPICSRTDEIIEPLITTQWFVSMKEMAQAALKVAHDGDVNFIPDVWLKNYEYWLSDIQDWCVSRQLWWGHQIPAWSDEAGQVYVGLNIDEVRAHYGLANDVILNRDQDVLDTWFSSALWPFVTLGWPHSTPEYKDFFPTSTLVTGFDILFFWVARMIMFSLYFTKKIPFSSVYIHGLVQDAHGQKMSKSKGNVIDPIDLIDGISLEDLLNKRTSSLMQPEKAQEIAEMTKKDYPNGFDAYGVDALRFTFCLQASLGRFVRFDLKRVDSSSNFCNKIWNMGRFVLMQLEGYKYQGIIEIKHPINRWILKELDGVAARLDKHLQSYRFDFFAQDLLDFTWKTLCDDYLEFSKVLLKDQDQRYETQQVLAHVVQKTLALLHPVMPFITEELHKALHDHIYQGAVIHTLLCEKVTLPEISVSLDESVLIDQVPSMIDLLTAIRTMRSKMNVSPKEPMTVRVQDGAHVQLLIKNFYGVFKEMTKLEKLELIQSKEDGTALAFGTEKLFILIDRSGDKEVHLQRLNQDKTKVLKEIEKAQTKLANPSFVERAPAPVLQQEQERLAAYEKQLEAIEAALQQLID